MLWVSESSRPLSIVGDKGYKRLMKTGRPHTFIPSARTLGRDVLSTFRKCQDQIREKLKVSARYPDCLYIGLVNDCRWNV